VQLATIFGEFVLSFYCYIFAISLGDSRQQETPGVIFSKKETEKLVWEDVLLTHGQRQHDPAHPRATSPQRDH
jgi:hypothetical protein